MTTNIYAENSQGWASVNTSFITKSNKTQVVKDTTKMAFIELAKAVSNAGMLALVGLGAFFVAAITFKLAAFVVGWVAFPAAIIPPLYNALTTLGGLAVGSVAGYFFTKSFGQKFLNQMNEHFNYSMHLFSEANKVRKLDMASAAE